MSDGKISKVKIGRWKVMATNLQPQLEKMPHLTGRYTELVKLTGDAETLENRQAQLNADSQEINRQRRNLLKTGEDLRNRIGAVLRAENGFDSERLLEFGLKPKRPRGRSQSSKKKTTAEPPTTATPAQ
jgi:hypothetical protein